MYVGRNYNKVAPSNSPPPQGGGNFSILPMSQNCLHTLTSLHEIGRCRFQREELVLKVPTLLLLTAKPTFLLLSRVSESTPQFSATAIELRHYPCRLIRILE